MKCKKCSSKNINSANYCKSCGNKFTNEEQKQAKRWTLVWFLEGKDKLISFFNLSFIGDHIKNKVLKVIYKMLPILIVLAIGIYSVISNGLNLKINESEDYTVEYNVNEQEYYLLSSKEQAELNLYIPNRAKELNIKLLDKENKVLETENYVADEKIVLDKNEKGNYYMIEAKYSDSNLDRIKLYVYLAQDMEVQE